MCDTHSRQAEIRYGTSAQNYIHIQYPTGTGFYNRPRFGAFSSACHKSMSLLRHYDCHRLPHLQPVSQQCIEQKWVVVVVALLARACRGCGPWLGDIPLLRVYSVVRWSGHTLVRPLGQTVWNAASIVWLSSCCVDLEWFGWAAMRSSPSSPNSCRAAMQPARDRCSSASKDVRQSTLTAQHSTTPVMECDIPAPARLPSVALTSTLLVLRGMYASIDWQMHPTRRQQSERRTLEEAAAVVEVTSSSPAALETAKATQPIEPARKRAATQQPLQRTATTLLPTASTPTVLSVQPPLSLLPPPPPPPPLHRPLPSCLCPTSLPCSSTLASAT